jgi:hypothetical protein
VDETAAEGIAGGLELLGSQAIAELMQKAPGAEHRTEDYEGDDQGTKDLGEQGLHFRMILQGDAAEVKRQMALEAARD